MKVLRIILFLILAPMVLVSHDLLVALCVELLEPERHDMLGFGVHIYLTGWAFVILLPLSIGLGELWTKGRKKHLPHVLLLVSVALWSIEVWQGHPNRTILFLACCVATLPLRFLIDHYTVRK